MKRVLVLVASHSATVLIGFALGIYLLPILTAQSSPDAAVLEAAASEAAYSANLMRDLPGSDGFHWGEGKISVSREQIIHEGELAPGPDYKVYLAPSFADDEESFEAIKPESVFIGDVTSFEGFLLSIPDGVEIHDYNTVVVWCESFGEFITAAQYRS